MDHDARIKIAASARRISQQLAGIRWHFIAIEKELDRVTEYFRPRPGTASTAADRSAQREAWLFAEALRGAQADEPEAFDLDAEASTDTVEADRALAKLEADLGRQ